MSRVRYSVRAGCLIMGRKPVEVLVFELDGRRFGIAASEVREIVRAVTIAPLPKAPLQVEGIISLRGRVILVVDIRRRLALPAKPPDVSDQLIVGQVGEHLAAIRVDRALELAQVQANTIDHAGGALSGTDAASDVAVLPNGIVPICGFHSLLCLAESPALAGLLAASRSNAKKERRS